MNNPFTVALIFAATTAAHAEIPAAVVDAMRPNQVMAGTTEIELPAVKGGSRGAVSVEVLMLPMVWNGVGARQVSLTSAMFTNSTDQKADLIVEFLDQNGARVDLPVDNNGIVQPSRILGAAVAPMATVGFLTSPVNQAEQLVHARVTISPAGSLTVGGLVAVERDGVLSLLGLPAAGANFKQVMSNGTVSTEMDVHAVLSNAIDQPQPVRMTAYFSNGQVACSQRLMLGANAVSDFSAREALPCLRFTQNAFAIQTQVESSTQAGFGAALYNVIGSRLGSQTPIWR